MKLNIKRIHITFDDECTKELSMIQKSFSRMIEDHIYRFVNIVNHNPNLEQTFRTEIHFDNNDVFVIALSYENEDIECAVGMINGRIINSEITPEQAININLYMPEIKMALYRHEKQIKEKCNNISKVSMIGKYKSVINNKNIHIPMYGGSLNRQPYLEEKKYNTYVDLDER